MAEHRTAALKQQGASAVPRHEQRGDGRELASGIHKRLLLHLNFRGWGPYLRVLTSDECVCDCECVWECVVKAVLGFPVSVHTLLVSIIDSWSLTWPQIDGDRHTHTHLSLVVCGHVSTVFISGRPLFTVGCVCVCVYICMCICVYIWVCICECISVCVCIWVCVYLCVSVSVCVCYTELRLSEVMWGFISLLLTPEMCKHKRISIIVTYYILITCMITSEYI